MYEKTTSTTGIIVDSFHKRLYLNYPIGVKLHEENSGAYFLAAF